MRLSDHVCFRHSPLVPRLGEPGLMNPNSVNEPQEMARGDHSCRLRGIQAGGWAHLHRTTSGMHGKVGRIRRSTAKPHQKDRIMAGQNHAKRGEA